MAIAHKPEQRWPLVEDAEHTVANTFHTPKHSPAISPGTGKSVAEVHIQKAYWKKRVVVDASPSGLDARPLMVALAVPRSGLTW